MIYKDKYIVGLAITAVLLLQGLLLSGQSKIDVSGYVYDADTNAPLQGASIVEVMSGRGVISDLSGAFRIKLNSGELHLKVSYLGFQAIDTVVAFFSTDSIDFHLLPGAFSYQEVTVTADLKDDFVSSVRSGDITLNRSDINSLPKLLGEADPIRFLQLTPGVQSSSEGGIGFFVRGGGVDQNLVLFNNAPIYNPGHLLGFISVFNPDIISEVSLIKSGIPAQFGGRLSSVVNVNSDQGRSDSLRVKGQIGMVASRITLNRSFSNDRGSFILSGRRASIDLFVKPIIFPLLSDANPFLKESSYNFYDLTGGISYRIGKNDYLSVSAFYGQDDYGIERSASIAETKMNWGNYILSGKWNHVFNEKMVLATTFSRSDYHFDLSGALSEYIFSLVSSVEDYMLKSKLESFGGKHKISLGYELTRHSFVPNDIDANAAGLAVNFLSYNKLFAYEGGVFVEDEFRLSNRVEVSMGLRYSFFNQVGPYKEYVYDEISLIKDSTLYSRGQSLAFYHHPEPRISAKYQLTEQSSFKASYMHMAQYIHLATSSSVSLPTDIWLPSSRTIKPQFGDQFSLGYFTKTKDDVFESSVEIYYKSARNQIEFLRGVITTSINSTLEENMIVGKGQSYGAEFFLRKKTGVFTGWAGYTISRSLRQFDQINNGMIYPAKFDRRHDLSIAGIYKLSPRWNFSAVFVYVSGNAFTLPIGRYIIQGNLVNEYGDVNNYRMPAYHRIDFSATRTRTSTKGNVSTWDFSVYNIYNRANPFYIYFEITGNLEQYRLDVKPVIVSLFPIVPTIS
nr:TonB-dependent receptor [Bacteroidales bacterium]